ncbi:hypothetical protein HCA58_06765 [Micromonospora sp. HNM0581]|uniref:LppU/SCO3897 family protein n=1 Tax=Micromonospora sp. HNM0581 TaxID=2716341 RepID=UPI00146D5357|nr:hypothetical protein [Micromonospora sp. HNM0581]NLU78092.1 hypothetical protein [Micromonospora sp. HNM0581]
MANYGPPGPQPWHQPQPDQWYGHGRSSGAPPSHDPGRIHESGRPYGDGFPGGASAQESWTRSAWHDPETGYAGTPVPPPQRGRGRLLVVLTATVVLALGGATAFYLVGRGGGLVGRDGGTSTPVAAPTEAAAEPDARDEEIGPDDPAAADPRFVQAGECVRNDAAAGGEPRLLLSECAPSSYEVLRRFDGKTSGERDAEEKCAAVDGYTNWYFYDSELDSLDFVLCLRQRD